MEIHLEILGEPKAQARHRHFSRGKFHGTYDPSKDKKESFASIIQKDAPREPIIATISLEIVFYMSRPRNHYRSGKNSELLKDSAPEYHSSRPDIDNLQKFVMDSMNKIFWRDDSQISKLFAEKKYSERPRVEITIKTL
jgi:Holliday junction resolvase RusA-like endonuclease